MMTYRRLAAVLVVAMLAITSPAAEISSDDIVLPARPWHDSVKETHDRASSPHQVLTGHFLIESRMILEPTLRCDYIIPVSDDGRPLGSAADMVLAIPYQGAKDPFLGRTELARTFGFTLFGLSFPNSGNAPMDEQHHLIYPESGSGTAWLLAQARVRTIAGFPNQPMYVIGLSSGGTAAQRFCEAYPDRVAAVVSWAGHNFTEKSRFTGPIFLCSGMLDKSRNESIDRLAERMIAIGAPVLHLLAVPPVIGEERLHQDREEHVLPSGPADLCIDTWLGETAELIRHAPGRKLSVPKSEATSKGRWFPGKLSEELARGVSLDFPHVLERDDGFGCTDQVITAMPMQQGDASDLVVLISHSPIDDHMQQLFDIHEHVQAGRTVIGIFDQSHGASDALLAAVRRLPKAAFGTTGKAVIVVSKSRPGDASLIEAIQVNRRVVIYEDLAGEDRWVDLTSFHSGGAPVLLATRKRNISVFEQYDFMKKNAINGIFTPKMDPMSSYASHYFVQRCADAVLAGMTKMHDADWGSTVIPMGSP